MIHKWSWGIALILLGAMLIGIAIPYLSLMAGIALIVAGISGIIGV